MPAGKEANQLEYWVVELKQILSTRNKKQILGANLLTQEGPGPGGDNFPREDLVGILYPSEEPKNILEKIRLRQPNGGYYPIRNRRVVQVENFFVIIEVTSFAMDPTSPTVIQSMNVSVEFRNRYRDKLD